MVHAAEARLMRDLREGKLVVYKKLLNFFCALKNEELFNGLSFNGGKQVAEVAVVVRDAICNERRKVLTVTPRRQG